jgi:diguanylate cyclase (GGDEF)-like protein
LFCFLLAARKRIRSLKLEDEALEEKINLLNDEVGKENYNKTSLEAKIRRYSNLKEIIERINRAFELESVAKDLVKIIFSLIGNNKGTALLYLLDRQSHKLILSKVEKEDKGLVIKSKEGDIFDFWVLRHSSALLVEDIGKDFRFDMERLSLEDQRAINSLISSPLLSENKLVGVLRLDSPKVNAYSQDDLRLLSAISDLGAVALENAELFQRTQDLATHDELTSLYTKGYLLERLKEECKRSIRYNKPLALSMLDIDHFKNYNDKFGHTAGDLLLKQLAFLISDYLKGDNVIVSRFGGEEFCIAISGLDKKQAAQKAEALRLHIEKKGIILRRQETKVTVSIGLSVFPEDATDGDELILKADKALYEAKGQGRNRVVVFK